MRKMPLLCLLLYLAAVTAQAQKVSNIRSTLEPSCGYYTITFDLEGEANELYLLKMVPYLGGMEITNAKFEEGSGLDSPVNPGKGLQVFWNPVLEGVGTGNWQFRLEAKTSSWIFVEGGSFMMGSNDGESHEKPVHQVTVSSFLIGKYEVTQKEWTEVMGSNPSNWKGDNLPVEGVSWLQAIEYCNKRSLKEGLKPCYSGSGASISCDWSANGYRLPTEAEWEYAARGGKQSKAFKYSGSNELGTVAWSRSSSGNRTHEVGIKQPNELGIYDMSGNVWEWCWDWYGSAYYSKSPNADPRGPASGSTHPLRGGGWNDIDSFCRTAVRYGYNPSKSISNYGFRVSRAFN